MLLFGYIINVLDEDIVIYINKIIVYGNFLFDVILLGNELRYVCFKIC